MQLISYYIFSHFCKSIINSNLLRRFSTRLQSTLFSNSVLSHLFLDLLLSTLYHIVWHNKFDCEFFDLQRPPLEIKFLEISE